MPKHRTIKPETPEQWAAYRAVLNCELGIQTMEGKKSPPNEISREGFALYNLLHAVKSLAEIHLPNVTGHPARDENRPPERPDVYQPTD